MWFAGPLVTALAVALVYVRLGVAGCRGVPGASAGCTFGTIAAAALLLRRRSIRCGAGCWPGRSAPRSSWLQLHIYGGSVALLCVFIHMGFDWPRGTMGWWLLGCRSGRCDRSARRAAAEMDPDRGRRTTLRVEALASADPGADDARWPAEPTA